MKNILTLAAFTLATAASSLATALPVTYTTTLGTIGPAASYKAFSFTFQAFDPVTQKLTVKTDANYGGVISGTTFGTGTGFPYTIGDLFFYNSSIKYGVAMTSHNGLTQGDLYLSPNVLNAGTVAGATAGRPNQEVQIGGGSTFIGAGTLSTLNVGGTEWVSTITFDASNAAFKTFLAGTFQFDFASATCGNDVVYGTVNGISTTPEPASMALIAGGLAVLAIRRKVA